MSEEQLNDVLVVDAKRETKTTLVRILRNAFFELWMVVVESTISLAWQCAIFGL